MYDKAIKIDPKFYDAYNNKGNFSLLFLSKRDFIKKFIIILIKY